MWARNDPFLLPERKPIKHSFMLKAYQFAVESSPETIYQTLPIPVLVRLSTYYQSMLIN